MSGVNGSVALIKEAESKGYAFDLRSDGKLKIKGREGEYLDRLLSRSDEIKKYLGGETEPPVEQREPPVEPFRPFPLDVLPKPIRRFVEVCSRAIGCDESYVVLPLLSALAGAIGNSRCLLLKRGWSAPAILWTVCVGESGSQKTPPFRIVMEPIRDLQRHAIKAHGELMQDHEQRKVRHEADLARWKRKPVGDPPTKPDTPPTPRLIVSDSTVEALASVLQDNPRGVLLARDELSGWIGSFDKYSRGSGDVSHWLSMYNGETLLVDRKTGERLIVVPHASVSIAGGIQPAILKTAIRGELRESGLFARLLLAFPPARAKRWTDTDIPPEVISGVESVIDNLMKLQPVEVTDGDLEPGPVWPLPEALSVFVEFYNEHAGEAAELSGDLAAVWSKLEEAAARLSLIHYLTRYAAGDVSTSSALDSESMTAGVIMARWFGYEAKRVLAMLDESDGEGSQRRLVGWIGKRGGSVTVRETQQGHRNLPTAEDAEIALNELRDAGYGTWDPKPPTSKGGQPTRVFELFTTSTSTQPPKTPGIR